MRKLQIDIQDLLMAMEHSDEADYYLDRETGELNFVSSLDPEVTEEFASLLEADPDRYEPVDKIDSHTGFEIMEDFIATLPVGEIARELEEALRRRRPFRQFKDVLLNHPDQQAAWFRYHDERCTRIALDWLESVDIEPLPPAGK